MTPKQSATLADLHLVTYTWANRPQLSGDSILAMEYFFDYCLKTDSSAKLLGDMFHTLTPRPEYVKPLFDKLDQMQAAGLPVYYIQGNHDLNLIPWMSLHPWPVNLNKKIIELPECGMTILGQQSTDHDELMYVFNSIPDGVDTLLLHQAEMKALPFSHEFELDDVPETIKNVLIGHIHTPQDYTNGATQLWYPGSPSVTSIDSAGPKGFLVEKVVNGVTEIGREWIPGRSFYSMTLEWWTRDDYMDVAERNLRDISENDSRWNGLNPVVKIDYPSALSQQVHQRLIDLREPLQIYTWLDTIDGENTETEEENQFFKGNIDMADIINNNVDQPIPRELLLHIYGGNNTGDVLRSGLEKIL